HAGCEPPCEDLVSDVGCAPRYPIALYGTVNAPPDVVTRALPRVPTQRHRSHRPARKASRSCRVTTPAGLPSMSTNAPSAELSAFIAEPTDSLAPSAGNGGDMCSSNLSASCTRPVNNS